MSEYWTLLFGVEDDERVVCPAFLDSSALLLKVSSGEKPLARVGTFHQISFLPGAGFVFFSRHEALEGIQTVILDNRYLYRIAFMPYQRTGRFSLKIWKPNQIQL